MSRHAVAIAATIGWLFGHAVLLRLTAVLLGASALQDGRWPSVAMRVGVGAGGALLAVEVLACAALLISDRRAHRGPLIAMVGCLTQLVLGAVALVLADTGR